jgi:DNA gyrase subunit B
MSDADVDGLHITTLVLTLLFRFFRPLIEEGYVYVAQPPLFKVEIGKQRYYFINDKEKEKFVKKAKSSGKNPVVNRFKGLGEMDPEQLWETTMNPETRVLKRVKIEDAQEAEHTFEMLMGTEVPPRRRFIQKHANQAILDV